MSFSGPLTFGPLLKQLRKQAGMTQRDLAAALGYSESLISSLEKAKRRPDLNAVTERFVPALGLQDDPQIATALIAQAALARGERLPASVTFPHTIRLPGQDTLAELVEAEPVATVPALPTELIGRAVAVNQLCNRLLGHRGRLLTLVGPPGVGKTTLALAVAANLQLHYRDGVIFVPLAAVTDPVVMATTIIAAVSSSDRSPQSPQTRLIEVLRRKTVLLVLDNLEQIHAAAPLIAKLVAECPGVCILATSRERLHLRAEQRFKVPPLDLGAAVELFVERAQAVDADFALTAQNQPTLAAICQRLDCLPLAIELCAVQIDLRSPSQLLAQLQDRRLDLLVDGAHDLPPQQRTLRAAIERSYALLTETERTHFRSLGVFAGGFDLAAVEAMGGWQIAGGEWRLNDTGTPHSAVTILHALIGKSLVRAETLPTGEPRFLLLETIREFALEKLRAHDEETLLRQRHYDIYLHLFRTMDRPLRGPEAATLLARLRLEQDNLRAALQWTYAEARYTEMSWLIAAASWFWFLCDYGYERGRWLQQLWPHRTTLATDLRLSNLINLYGSAMILAELQPVDRYTDELMGLLEGCTYNLLQAVGWYFLAQFGSDATKTEVALERSVTLARTAGDAATLGAEFCCHADRDFILPANLLGYGTFLLDQGEVARATEMVTESLQRFRSSGNQPWIIGNLGHMGRLALLRGDLTQAHEYFHEVATLASTHQYPTLQGEWQPLLALVTLYRGDMEQARHLLHESLTYGIEMKQKHYLARNYAYLAEVALWEGELAQAEQWLVQSLIEYADPDRNAIFHVERLFVAARLATAQQEYPRAAMLFGLAEQIHSRIHHVIGGPMRALADAALATVQAALEPAVFAEAFAAGQQMSLDEGFATLVTAAPIPGT